MSRMRCRRRRTHRGPYGVQYLAIRYTQRLAETGVVASVGSRGESYANALAEASTTPSGASSLRSNADQDIGGASEREVSRLYVSCSSEPASEPSITREATDVSLNPSLRA